ARLPQTVRRVNLAAALPRVLRELDDERAHRLAVRIRVGLDGADVGLRDEELEGVEDESSAEPDVAGVPHFDLGLGHAGQPVSGDALHAVGGDDEVVSVAQPVEVWRGRAVMNCDADLCAPLAQYLQQALPADR